MARHERYFARAKEFLPERWLPVGHPHYDEQFANDRKEASRPFSLGLTVDQSEARGRSNSGALPGHGVFWGFQEGPLNTLFGFDEGVYGEFHTQGKLVRGAQDGAVVPGLWARYRADFPEFFDAEGF